jgi:phosphoserine phosphatase
MSDPLGTDPSQTDASASAAWQVSEAEAVTVAKNHAGLVIVDLDETLYLRNSTEQFISLARPAFMAALLLRLLDLVGPWRWSGGSISRDNWRVMLIMILFPWTISRWRQFCQTDVPQFVNKDLREALAARTEGVVIASNGYRRIIKPMLAAFGLKDAELICCSLRRFHHRSRGKLTLMLASVPQSQIAGAAVITDSLTDAPLLAACEKPCLTVWSAARYEKAFPGKIYLPGDYLSRVKRPRQGAFKSLIKEDLVVWVLVGLSVTPTISEFAGLTLLFFSMWSFYELGYFDNDRCALKYETDPRVTKEFQAIAGTNFALKAAIVGTILGLLGILALDPSQFVRNAILWSLGMAGLCCVYFWYNRVDKTTRVWIYLPLQIFRFGSLFLVVPASAVGLAIMGSQMIARWIDYMIYRYVTGVFGKSSFPKRPQKTVRFAIFLLLICPIILEADWQQFLTPASFAAALYFVYAIRWELKGILASYKRLDR